VAKQLKIKDLQKDKRNANQGTERGGELLNKSFQQHGAGRSILVDKNGQIIAGNHAYDSALEAGIEDVIIVPSDGKKLVVVQRTDIDLDSNAGRALALADNITAKENISLDMDVVQELATDFGIDLGEIGIEIRPDLPSFDDDEEEYEGNGGGSGGADDEVSENQFPLAISVNKATQLEWYKIKKAIGTKSDTEAFMMLFRFAKQQDIDFSKFIELSA